MGKGLGTRTQEKSSGMGGRGGVIETRNGALRDLHASKIEGWDSVARHNFPQRSAYVGTPEFAF